MHKLATRFGYKLETIFAMSIVKSTSYAPDVFRSLNGILLIHKPANIHLKKVVDELKNRISSSLNQLEPRPISSLLRIEGELGDEKRIVELPNLADHPLVAGPRYNPWEVRLAPVRSYLSERSSGLCILTLGAANKTVLRKMSLANFVNVYHLSGRFGYVTSTFFHDGKIQDKSTYKHIRTGKFDAVLARIEASQNERLFDSAHVPLNSQEAYDLAKAWPSRPPRMSKWPVIYRIRCIHLQLPEFKIELTVLNETQQFLAQLVHEIGLMLKSGAYTDSIRRVKHGPFDVKDSLTDKEWDLQSIVNHLSIQAKNRDHLKKVIEQHTQALAIRV